MKKMFLVAIIFISFKTIAQTTKFGGVYLRDYDTTGVLDLYPESDSTLLFYIEDWRKLDNNSGAMVGRIFMKEKDSAIFYFNEVNAFNCMLSFKFKTNKIIVTTITGHDDCGNGYGVDNDGIYYWKDQKPPQYFIDRHGHTNYFTKLLNLPLDSLIYNR